MPCLPVLLELQNSCCRVSMSGTRHLSPFQQSATPLTFLRRGAMASRTRGHGKARSWLGVVVIAPLGPTAFRQDREFYQADRRTLRTGDLAEFYLAIPRAG